MIAKPDWLTGDKRSHVRDSATAAWERATRRDRRAGVGYRFGSLIQSGFLWADYGVRSVPQLLRRTKR